MSHIKEHKPEGKPVRILYRMVNGERMAVKVGTFDIACRYRGGGADTYYIVKRQDVFFLYQNNGDTATPISKSKNPGDFDKLICGE